MERCADGKRFGAFCAALVGEFAGAFDRGRVAGDHNLLRGVEIGGLADFALSGIETNCGDSFETHPKNCGHCAVANGHGFLHVFAAIAHGADGVGERNCAGGNVRGIFSQAVPGDHCGLNAFFREHTPGRNRRGEDGGLRDLGEAELVFGSLEAEVGQFVAERRIGLLEGLAGDGEFRGEVLSHADGLRSLAGK